MRPIEKLRVAIDATQIVSGGSGGVAQAILGLVHALGQLNDGSEEYVIVVDSQQQMDWLRPLSASNQQFVIRPPSPNRRGNNFTQRLRRSLRPAARYIRHHLDGRPRRWPEIPVSDGFYESLGCEVLHFPHQGFILCALPTIYTPHDLQHLHYPQFFTASAIAGRETIYRGGCQLAQTVVVASQWIKDDVVRQYGVSPEKVQIIPWGAPTQAFSEPAPEHLLAVKSRYQLEQPFAIFPAVTWPHKNHLRLFEALAAVRAQHGLIVRLVCTGSRYEPFWPQIEARLDALALRSQVKFLGFVPDEDLRAIYRLSQFLVMPTLFESDSFPIYEAWLEGVPVVCSNVCSLPDQVMDAATLFDPNDVESMADAIARLAINAALRMDLSRRGYRRLKDFDWECTAKSYRAVFRRAVNRRLSQEERRLLAWDWMREPQRQGDGQP
jgi:glycosyltransferase involved in cell wall biosynthesis